MFGKKHRRQLEELDERVEAMQSEVPEEAQAFHRQCESIRNSVHEMLSRWFFLDKDQLRKLEAKAEKLDALSSELTLLIHSGQEAAERVHRLRNMATSADTEIAQLVTAKCEDWIKAIQKLGSDIDHNSLLQLDRGKILELQNEIRDYSTVMELLEKAEAISHDLGPTESSALSAKLLKWKEEFRIWGSNAQRLAELAEIVKPLEHKVQAPPLPVPKAFDDVNHLFEEWREWLRVLDEKRDSRLEESYRRMNQMQAAPSDTQELLHELSAELAKLRERATAERAHRLSELRQDAVHYRRACGDSDEMDSHLNQLESNPADTFQNYQQWINQYENVERMFSNLAQARVNVLSADLEKQRVALEQRRRGLIDGSPSSAVRTEATSLGASIADLSQAAGQLAIRAALRSAEQLKTKISEIEKQAKEESKVFDRRKSSLMAQIGDLKDAAKALEKHEIADQCTDLAERIPREDAQSNDLDEKNSLLAGAEAKFGALEKVFLQFCSQSLDELFEYCREAHSAVMTAAEGLGRAFPERKFSREKPRPVTTDDARRTCEKWRQLQTSYVERMRELAGPLLKAIQEAQTNLQKLTEQLGYLTPEQRDQADELISDLSGTNSTQPGNKDVLANFASSADALDRYQTFIRLVEGGKEELQRSLEALKNRLRKFSEENFKKLFPEAAERASALVYGINPNAVFVDTKQPLRMASELLGIMESQVRRLGAEELEEACAEAEVYLRTPGRPRAEELRNTLQEIQEFSPLQLAPSSLRRRLLQYLNLSGGAGHA